jgi:hypothetical protein
VPIPGQTIAIVANGQRETSQHATLDGIVATESRVNTVPFSPSPEAMEEVRVISGSYSAEYGFNSGAQLVMIMRSGTNDCHGSVYDFLRNEKFDAEDYFQNYFNAPGQTRVRKTALRQNQFGAVLGGPVIMPGFKTDGIAPSSTSATRGGADVSQARSQPLWCPRMPSGMAISAHS